MHQYLSRKSAAPLLPLALLGCAALLMSYSEIASRAAQNAMKLCAAVIIPSLFPYMVISSLLVLSGAAAEMGGWFSRPVRHLFRLPGCAGSAILLGALCGFPVGAKSACEMYEGGSLSKKECERLIAIANNTGPSFVVEVVGAHFWGSRGMGICIYAVQILSALLIGFVEARGMSPRPATADGYHPAPRTKGFMECLSESVSTSARAVVSVCGFIVFFAVSAGLLSHMLNRFHMGGMMPYFGAVLEFSFGAEHAARLGGTAGAFLTGFSVGWSGLSIFAQCAAFTSPHGIGLRHTAICKCIQGMLVGAAAAVYEAYFFVPSAVSSTVIPRQDIPAPVWVTEILILAVLALFSRRKSAIS